MFCGGADFSVERGNTRKGCAADSGDAGRGGDEAAHVCDAGGERGEFRAFCAGGAGAGGGKGPEYSSVQAVCGRGARLPRRVPIGAVRR